MARVRTRSDFLGGRLRGLVVGLLTVGAGVLAAPASAFLQVPGPEITEPVYGTEIEITDPEAGVEVAFVLAGDYDGEAVTCDYTRDGMTWEGYEASGSIAAGVFEFAETFTLPGEWVVGCSADDGAFTGSDPEVGFASGFFILSLPASVIAIEEWQSAMALLASILSFTAGVWLAREVTK